MKLSFRKEEKKRAVWYELSMCELFEKGEEESAVSEVHKEVRDAQACLAQVDVDPFGEGPFLNELLFICAKKDLKKMSENK